MNNFSIDLPPGFRADAEGLAMHRRVCELAEAAGDYEAGLDRYLAQEHFEPPAGYRADAEGLAMCRSACKNDPVSGVIGVEK